MKLGIYRLRRHKHKCGLRRLARQDIARRDIVDMLFDRIAKPPGRGQSPRVIRRIAQRVVALKRKLRINNDGAGRIRQIQQAVCPAAIGELRLKLVGGRRQNLLHQIIQLDFTERTAGLLVGQNILQTDHLVGELGNIVLCLVDHGQALFQPAHRLQRFVRARQQAVFQGLVELQLLLMEPLGHRRARSVR